MRAARTAVGVVLMVIGLPALVLALAGWWVQRQAGPVESFSAQLSSVRTDGYAITVPDVPAVLGRHVVARVLGSDQVRITVEAATAPVVLWLVPHEEMATYLDGVARTELSAVGFARGAQPVELTEVAGAAVPAPPAQQPFWISSPSGRSLEWDRSTDDQTSIMLVRADGLPGLAATLTVSVYPSWLDEATWIAGFGGVVALLAAAALLVRRDRSSQLVITEREQLLAFADLVADRLSDHHSVAARPLAQDLTGELVPVAPAARQPAESPYIHSAT